MKMPLILAVLTVLVSVSPVRSQETLTAPRTDLVQIGEVNPARAMIMTPVFPGWGQLNADNGWRAALAFGVEAYYLSRVLMNQRKARRMQAYMPDGDPDLRLYYADQAEEYWELMRDNSWRAVGALFFITVDAYVGAHLHRFDQDRLPVPDNWEPGNVPQPIELPQIAAGHVGNVLMRLTLNF